MRYINPRFTYVLTYLLSTVQVDEVMGKRGQARHIAARFKRVDADDEEGRKKPRDMIVIDLAAGPSVLENEPAPCRPDVVRSDSAAELAELAAVERGTTRNLVASWKNKGHEQLTRQASTPKSQQLQYLLRQFKNKSESRKKKSNQREAH